MQNLKRIVLYTIVAFAIIFTLTHNQKTNENHVIVIDAGSTGSRATLYTLSDNKITPKSKITAIAKTIIEPGVSVVFAGTETPHISQYFKQLLNFDESILSKAARKNTKVYVLATAGMRNLPHPLQENIVRIGNFHLFQTLTNLGYDLALKEKTGIEIISGKQEGLFAWLAINYLTDNLSKNNIYNSHGVLDLGGASTQIAFLPKDKPLDEFVRFLQYNDEYLTYSLSYSHYGMSLAFQDVVTKHDATMCLPKQSEFLAKSGLKLIGKGDYLGCANYIKENFIDKNKQEKCLDIFANSCSLFGEYQPVLPKQKFYAISGYYKTLKNFNLTEQELSLQDINLMAKQVCETDFSDLKNSYDIADKKLIKSCFNLSLIKVLLEAYGFGETEPKISAVSEINKQNADWTLGALIYLANNRIHPKI